MQPTTKTTTSKAYKKNNTTKMKRRVLLLTRIVGLGIFYVLVLVASIFLTMSVLIKGEEVKAPALAGKSLSEAYRLAAEKGVYLKKIRGNYGKQYKPLTVINQFPNPGVKIKEKSFITVYVTSEVVEVVTPDLVGYNLKECEKLIRDNNLRKRYISYVESGEAPVDSVISQSIPAGTRIPEDSWIDILVSKGPHSQSYIMPDVIGKNIDSVRAYFEEKGLKISKETPMDYPGLPSGTIIMQRPQSGFQINDKARVHLGVTK